MPREVIKKAKSEENDIMLIQVRRGEVLVEVTSLLSAALKDLLNLAEI